MFQLEGRDPRRSRRAFQMIRLLLVAIHAPSESLPEKPSVACVADARAVRGGADWCIGKEL